MRRPLSMLIAGSVLMAACGTSSSTDTTASPADPTAPPVTLPRDAAASPDPVAGPTTSAAAPTTAAEAPPPNLFPDVEVIEIATGEPVNLQSLGVIDRPVLLWFWAPH